LRSPESLGASEIHEPADPDSSGAADLFNPEMGKLGRSARWLAREIGMRKHRADGGEAGRLAPDWPSECELTVAVEIQAALQRANEGEPEGLRMRFRIGVNVGDVMVKEGDIFGDGVNVAARLEVAGQGRRDLRLAGRARSPVSSRRHDL
jgi:class 3 adenylate cyclase